MAAFGSLLFKRTLNQYLEIKDTGSVKSLSILKKIKESAKDNLDKILDAIPAATEAQAEELKSICSKYLESAGDDFFLSSMSSDNTEIRSSVKDLLVEAKPIDAKRLFRRLHEPDVFESEIIDLLEAQASQLKPEDIIFHALKLTSSDGFRLLQLAKKSEKPLDITQIILQPEKIRNPAFKIELLSYLSSVQQAEVSMLILPFLSDSNKRVVLEALKSLSKLTVRFDVTPILPLFPTMSDVEQEMALEVITSQINPMLIPKLAQCFTGKVSTIHEALAKVIADHASKNSFAEFLLLIEPEDPWSRDQTFDLLLGLNNKNLLNVAKELCSHDNEFVRGSAQKIAGFQIGSEDLGKIGEFALSDDWQVRLRAIQTLGKSANRLSVGILSEIVKVRPDAAVSVLEAVKQLGFSKGLEIAFDCLDSSDVATQRAALETIGKITTEKHTESACDSIRWKMPDFSEEMVAYANLILDKLAPQTKSFDDATVELKAVVTLDKLKPGATWLDRYLIQQEIGRGAMGIVMRVEDIMVGESLVLKFMHPELTKEKDAIERFRREFKYTRRVSHPSVIRVHDLFMKDKICALSMEFFKSIGLDVLLKKNGSFNNREGLEILLQVCSAMAAAHKQEVIHRDLKPSNILIDDTGHVKVVDFGIAAVTSGFDEALTQTGAIIGSPAYLAPERAEGIKADSRSDIYALGIIAFYMFSGELPYHGKPMDILLQHREGNAPLIHTINKLINPRISKLIGQMLMVDPGNRPETMLSVLDDIKSILSSMEE